MDRTSERVHRFYCVTCRIDGKKYVGQTTTTVKRRWQVHCYFALNKNGRTHLYNAIRLYGRAAFDVDVLHETTCNQDLADKIECALINEFKTNVPEFGYNMTAGGNTKDVVKFTPEMCAKISAAKLGKLLIVRRLKTQEEDRPIIDLFKAGKSRHEIEIELGVSKAKIQKALARWKERVDPNLPVGRNFWRHSSGLTLQKRADELNQPIVDLVAQGLSYKDVASQLNITRCKVRTAMQRYNRRKHASK